MELTSVIPGYGAGIRHRSSDKSVTCFINGQAAQVVYGARSCPYRGSIR